MSFANKLKQQLLNLRYDELRQLRARTHGLLRFSKAFGPQKMLLQTENKNVAEQYADSIFGLIGLDATISVNEYKNQNGKSFFCATVDVNLAVKNPAIIVKNVHKSIHITNDKITRTMIGVDVKSNICPKTPPVLIP